MKISVSTKQPNNFIRQTSQKLRARGHGDECAALLNGRFDGGVVRFEQLSVNQFTALKDTAAWMGMQYDASQE